MHEWITQAEEEYLERDFEYKTPDELQKAVEELKVKMHTDVFNLFLRVFLKLLLYTICLLIWKSQFSSKISNLKQ